MRGEQHLRIRLRLCLALVALCGADAWALRADLDGNGIVNADDLLLFLAEWHRAQDASSPTPSASGTPTATVTPTPSPSASATPTPTRTPLATWALVGIEVRDAYSNDPIDDAKVTLVVRGVSRTGWTLSDGVVLFDHVPFTQGDGEYALQVEAAGYLLHSGGIQVTDIQVHHHVALEPEVSPTPTGTPTLIAQTPSPSATSTGPPVATLTPTATQSSTATPSATLVPPTATPTRTPTPDALRGSWSGSASNGSVQIPAVRLEFQANRYLAVDLSAVEGPYHFEGVYQLSGLTFTCQDALDAERLVTLTLDGTLDEELARLQGTLLLSGAPAPYTYNATRIEPNP